MSSVSSFSKISTGTFSSEKPKETNQKILLNSNELILVKKQPEHVIQFTPQLSVEHQAMLERGFVNTHGRLTIKNLQQLPVFNLATKRLLVEFLKESVSFSYDQRTIEISRAEQIVYLKQHSSSRTIYNGTFLKGGRLAEIMCAGGYLGFALEYLDSDSAQRKKWLTVERLHAVKRRAPDDDMHTYFPIAQKTTIEIFLVEIFHRHLLDKIPPDPTVEPGKRVFLAKKAFRHPKKFWLDGIRFTKLVFDGSRNPVDWSLIQGSERSSLYLHHALQVPLDELAQAICQGVPEAAWPDITPTLLSFEVIPKPAPLEVRWQALISLYLNIVHFNDFSTINRFASSSLFSLCTLGMHNGEPDLEKELFDSLLKFFPDKNDIPLKNRFVERMTAMIGKKITYLDSIHSDVPFAHLWNSLEFLDKCQLDPDILDAIAKKIIKSCQKPVGTLARLIHLLGMPAIRFQDLKICLQLLVYSLLQNPKNKNEKVILRVTQHGARAIIRLKACDGLGDILIPLPTECCFSRFIEVAERLQAVPQWKHAFSQVMHDLWNVSGFKLVPFSQEDSKRAAASQTPLLKFMQLLIAKQEVSQKGLLPYLMTFSDAFDFRPDPILMNLWMSSLRNFFATSRDKAFKLAANMLGYFPKLPNTRTLQKKVVWIEHLIKCHEEIFSKEAWRVWKLDPGLSSEIGLVSLMLEEGGNGLKYALAMWQSLLPIDRDKREDALKLWIACVRKASKESAPRVLQLIPSWVEHHSYFVVPKELKLELYQAILALGESLPIRSRSALFNSSVQANWLDIRSDEAIQLISTLTYNFHQWPCLETAYRFISDIALWGLSKAFHSDSLIAPAIEVLALKLYENSFLEEGDNLFIQLALKSSERISERSRGKIKERLETIQEKEGDLALQEHRLFLAFESPDLLLSRTFLRFESHLDYRNHEQAFLTFQEICKYDSPLLEDSLHLARLLAAAPENETTLENLRIVSVEKGVSEAIKRKKEVMVEINCLLLKRLFLESKNDCSHECFKMASKILQHIHLSKVEDSVRETFVPLFIRMINCFWKPEISFPSQLQQVLNTFLPQLFACLSLRLKIELYDCLKIYFPVSKLHFNLISAERKVWVEFLTSQAEHPAVERLFLEVRNSGSVENYWNPLLIWIEHRYARRPAESVEWLLWLSSFFSALEFTSEELYTWKKRLKGTLESGRLAIAVKSQLPSSEASAEWLEEALDLFMQNNLSGPAWELIGYLSTWQHIDQFPSLFSACQKQFRLLLDKSFPVTPQALTTLQVFFPLFSLEWELVYREAAHLSDVQSIGQYWEVLLCQTVKNAYHPAASSCWGILFKNCFRGEQKQLWWALLDISGLNLLKDRFACWNRMALLENMFAELFEVGIDCFETAKNQDEHNELLNFMRASFGAIDEAVVCKWISLLIQLKKTFTLRTAMGILSRNKDFIFLKKKLYDSLETFPEILKVEKDHKLFSKMVHEELATSDPNVFLRILKKVDTIDSGSLALFIISSQLNRSPIEASYLQHFIMYGIRAKALRVLVANLLELPKLSDYLDRAAILEWRLQLILEEIKEAAKNESALFNDSVKLIIKLFKIENALSLLTVERFQEAIMSMIAILIREIGKSDLYQEGLEDIPQTAAFIHYSLIPSESPNSQDLEFILKQIPIHSLLMIPKDRIMLSRPTLFLLEWVNALLNGNVPVSQKTTAVVLECLERCMELLLPAISNSEYMDTIVEKFFLNPRFFDDVFFKKAVEILKYWHTKLDENGPCFLRLTIFLCEGKMLFKDVPVKKQSCIAGEVLEKLSQNDVMAFGKSIAIFSNIAFNEFAITSGYVLSWFKTLLNHWKNLSGIGESKAKLFFKLLNSITPIKFRMDQDFGITLIDVDPIENFKNCKLFPVFGEMLMLFYKELMHKFKDKSAVVAINLPAFNLNNFISVSLFKLALKGLFKENMEKYFEILQLYKEFLINQIDSDASWVIKHENICEVLKMHGSPVSNQSVVSVKEGELIAGGYVEWVERVLSHPVVRRNSDMNFRYAVRDSNSLCRHSPKDWERLEKLLQPTRVKSVPVKQSCRKKGKK